MKTLDLRVCELIPTRFYCNPQSCIFELFLHTKIYIKYLLERELYHDVLKIYCDCGGCVFPTVYQEIYRRDIANPTDHIVEKEEIIPINFHLVLGTNAYEKGYHPDFSQPGWLHAVLTFYDTYRYKVKKVKIRFYWDPKARRIYNFTATGLEPLRPCDIKIDYEPKTVTPNVPVNVTVRCYNCRMSGKFNLIVTLDNQKIFSRNVYVQPGADISLSMKLRNLSVGNHKLCADLI